jgi:hypothetical protein
VHHRDRDLVMLLLTLTHKVPSYIDI